MKKKIYNKKGFWSGVSLLFLAVCYTILLLNKWDNVNSMKNGKSILFAIICTFTGIVQIYRGLDSKCTKEDDQDDDERKKLVILKTESSAYKATMNISIVLTILLSIGIGVTKDNNLLGILVGVGIMPGIMVISYIFASVYHNKRN